MSGLVAAHAVCGNSVHCALGGIGQTFCKQGLDVGTSPCCACRAWCPITDRRTFMTHGNGVSRGDRNRNTRLTKLRAAVPVTSAIVGIDLAERKQMVVVTD